MDDSTATTSMAIVEDDPVLRQQLQELIDDQRDFGVVGAFGSGEEALEQLAAGAPELFLVDLGLPGMSGIELIRELKQRWPDAEIMSHTVLDDRSTVFDALTAGATGYLVKGAGPGELVAALRHLRDGGSPMSPHIARSVIQEFQRQQAIADQYTLSAREREVLGHIERGLSYREVGDALHISAHTVHTHIKNIYEKLQARNKKDALAKAKRAGIL